MVIPEYISLLIMIMEFLKTMYRLIADVHYCHVSQEIDQSSLSTPITKNKRQAESEERKTPKRKSLTPEDVLRKRLNILYKTVLEYQVSYLSNFLSCK